MYLFKIQTSLFLRLWEYQKQTSSVLPRVVNKAIGLNIIFPLINDEIPVAHPKYQFFHLRIRFLAYRELKNAIFRRNKTSIGSVDLCDM